MPVATLHVGLRLLKRQAWLQPRDRRYGERHELRMGP
jgi:hypothetical protein